MAPKLTTVTLRERPRAPNPARFMGPGQFKKEQAASHEPYRNADLQVGIRAGWKAGWGK